MSATSRWTIGPLSVGGSASSLPFIPPLGPEGVVNSAQHSIHGMIRNARPKIRSLNARPADRSFVISSM
jgi:hypothetical protein